MTYNLQSIYYMAYGRRRCRRRFCRVQMYRRRRRRRRRRDDWGARVISVSANCIRTSYVAHGCANAFSPRVSAVRYSLRAMKLQNCEKAEKNGNGDDDKIVPFYFCVPLLLFYFRLFFTA